MSHYKPNYIVMSDKLSFAELKKISANQAQTIRNENAILDNQRQDLSIKKAQLEMERQHYNDSKHADLRHEIWQCVDFAIRSLPWWRRSTRTVVDRATEYLLTIRSEVGKHAAMEAMAQKLVAEDAAAKLSPEQVAEVKADAEKTLDEVIGADRETAEMEQL